MQHAIYVKNARFNALQQYCGRYLEFIVSLSMLQVLVEILSELAIGEFVVKLNHRRLLDAMMDLCGVPPAKFRPICRYSPADFASSCC